jgi:DNA-binding response OmpR family regulator
MRNGSAEGRHDVLEAWVKGRVLVVDDDLALAEMLGIVLHNEGLDVVHCADGSSALAAFRESRPDVVLLDVMLPGIDGIEVCRRLRSAHDWTPVLFVTARDDEVDRIVGLELGADDYITKPFSPREIVARVTGVLRRTRGVPDESHELRVGAVRLDPGARRVFAGDAEVTLTATEFELLAHLMRRPGRVFSREQLLSDVWGYASGGGTRTVDVHIAQVRAKLGSASPVRTVRGVGYAVEERRA